MTASSTPYRKRLLAERARALRFQPTPTEAKLWAAIRGKRLGVQFRRQQVVAGQFVADFLAPSVGLIVEVDGDSYHAARSHADAQRDRKLRAAGYHVCHIPASVVERDLSLALAIIRAYLADCG